MINGDDISRRCDGISLVFCTSIFTFYFRIISIRKTAGLCIAVTQVHCLLTWATMSPLPFPHQPRVSEEMCAQPRGEQSGRASGNEVIENWERYSDSAPYWHCRVKCAQHAIRLQKRRSHRFGACDHEDWGAEKHSCGTNGTHLKETMLKIVLTLTSNYCIKNDVLSSK